MKTFVKFVNGEDNDLYTVVDSECESSYAFIENTVTEDKFKVNRKDVTEVVPTIADILHITADRYLSKHGESNYPVCKYSCDAIDVVCALLFCSSDTRFAIEGRIKEGLRNMGLNTDSLIAFDSFHDAEERQQARYGWLKLAALMAEEQGV